MSFKHLFAGIIFIGVIGHCPAGYSAEGLLAVTTKDSTTLHAPEPASEKETPVTTQKPQVSLTNIKRGIGVLNQQNLTAITSDIIAMYSENLTEEQLNTYIEMQAKLIDHLRNFKVTGIGVSGVAIDPNWALIYNNQNPTFDIYFKNATGEIKKRTYQASIKSLGIKIECAVNIHLFVFVNTDLNFFDANAIIPLSWGGELTIPLCPTNREKFRDYMRGMVPPAVTNVVELPFFSLVSLSFTYASIQNNGGLVMATLGFGPKVNIAGLVIGGSLTPVDKSAIDKFLQK